MGKAKIISGGTDGRYTIAVVTPEQVPLAQHQLIRQARRMDRPVIVATQMLESMITSARPTRAEVADVSNAVASGADAVMLSGETAVGDFAVDAVTMMSRIARQTESYQFLTRPAGGRIHVDPGHGAHSLGDAIAQAPVPFERLDILVLCQGVVKYRREEFQPAAFADVVEVNLNSLMGCAAKFHPLLKAAQGALIIVSSTAAFHSTKGNPAYNASKTGAMGLTRTLGEAWATDGIRVNGIAPGLVDTKMTKVTTSNPERLAGTIARIPAGRLGTPQDMAGVALFLASPMSAYVYGQTLPVDGGLILA